MSQEVENKIQDITPVPVLTEKDLASLKIVLSEIVKTELQQVERSLFNTLTNNHITVLGYIKERDMAFIKLKAIVEENTEDIKVLKSEPRFYLRGAAILFGVFIAGFLGVMWAMGII